MNTISRTLAVAWKEIQLLAKDRGGLAVLFLLPLLFSALYGSINLQVNRPDGGIVLLDVGLVNQDDGIFGQEIAKALKGIDELDVETFDSVADGEQQVAEGKATAAIVIPAGFTQDIDAYTSTSVDVIVDPAQPEAATIVTGIMEQVVAEVTIWGEVQYGVRTVLDESGLLAGASVEEQRAVGAQTMGAIMTQLSELRRTPAIVVASEDLEGASVTFEGAIQTFFAYLFPAITVMFVFFVVSSAASSLLAERETGTLRRLLAGPIPPGAIIAGKMLAFGLLVCLQLAVLFAVGSIFFGMPLGKSPVGLVLLSLVVALVANAMGMLIAALAKTSKQADNVGVVLGFVLAGVGGCVGLAAPITRLGGFISVLGQLTPHAHAVEGYYSLMAENATVFQILPQVGILLGMAIVFFAIATWRFKFD
jgi:ABC-2 type transport system permease protein